MRRPSKLANQFKVLWEDRADVKWLTDPEAKAGYLGWLNRGNAGDESMYLGHQMASPIELRRLPIQSVGLRLAKRASIDTLILGGGTLLGRREWGFRLEKAIEVFNPSRVVSFGVGVEEPSFALERNLISERELEKQASLLNSFDRIGVRGPRSQKHLAELGVESEVLGDPALLLQLNVTENGEPVSQIPRVLLSLAEVSDGYEVGGDRMRREIVQATKAIADNMGARLLGLAMEPKDVHTFRRVDDSLPVVCYSHNVLEIINLISDVDLVISERLHPNIIAAAVGTRFIAIGYKPKTYDFAESLGVGDDVMDVRDLSWRDLLAHADTVLTRNQSRVDAEVAKLGTRFRRSVDQELA